MCTTDCKEFVRAQLAETEVSGRKVLEVGAYDVNGSVRSMVRAMGPAMYVGVDVIDGPGVDVVCDVQSLVARFGECSFDVVISTEMLEHVADWSGAVNNLQAVLKPGGVLIVTTRSQGCHFHGYPADFWRFEASDMLVIFADMDIEAICPDESGTPGIFIRARMTARPRVELRAVKLYSIVRHRRSLRATFTDIAVSRAVAVAIRLGVKLLPTSAKRAGRRVLGLSRTAVETA